MMQAASAAATAVSHAQAPAPVSNPQQVQWNAASQDELRSFLLKGMNGAECDLVLPALWHEGYTSLTCLLQIAEPEIIALPIFLYGRSIIRKLVAAEKRSTAQKRVSTFCTSAIGRTWIAVRIACNFMVAMLC